MLEKDYIMRQMQMMIAALLRILHLIAGKDYFTAKAEIKDAVKLITGFSPDQLKKLEIEDLMMMFSLNKEYGYVNAAYTAKLLLEEGKILEEEKDSEQALVNYRKVLEIFEYLKNNKFKSDNIVFDIDEEINFIKTKLNHR